MCPLLGAPGEHNPARVFHTMQAHLHTWAPLGPCGPGPCGSPWALVGPLGPLWASLGALVGPHCALVGLPWAFVGPPWALVRPPSGACGPPLGRNHEHKASRFSSEPETLNATHKTD